MSLIFFLLHFFLEFLSLFYGLPLIPLIIISIYFTGKKFRLSKSIDKNKIKITRCHPSSIIRLNLTFNLYSKVGTLFLGAKLILIAFSVDCAPILFCNNLFILDSVATNMVFMWFCVWFIFEYIISLRQISYKENLNFSLTILFLLFPFIFLYNSLLAMFFFIEILNIIVFIVLIQSSVKFFSGISKFYSSFSYKATSVNKSSMLNYKYSLFSFYWLSFFFSIIINLLFIQLSNGFYSLDRGLLLFYTEGFIYSLVDCAFFKNSLGVFMLLLLFLKFGLPPLHILKLSVYRGLPLDLCLLYSIFIFFYLFFFTYLLFSIPLFIYILRFNLKFILLLVIIVSLLSIYREFNLKVYFGYSSIINISIIFLVLFTL